VNVDKGVVPSTLCALTLLVGFGKDVCSVKKIPL